MEKKDSNEFGNSNSAHDLKFDQEIAETSETPDIQIVDELQNEAVAIEDKEEKSAIIIKAIDEKQLQIEECEKTIKNL